MLKSISRCILSFIFIFTIAACATTDHDPSKWSAKEFYDKAQEAIENKDYQTAITHFEDLEINHPFSRHTQQAQLDVAYAYYKYDEPDSAIAAADRYIKLYPRSETVDYAYYIRGLINFDRGISSFDKMMGLEKNKRSPQHSKESYYYFSEMIGRYPDSKYVNDAKQRMVQLRNDLARYELHVADYYQRRGAYLSAANRAQYVIENYPQTTAIPNALVMLAKNYRQLNNHKLANDSIAVLTLNYPDHPGLDELKLATTNSQSNE